MQEQTEDREATNSSWHAGPVSCVSMRRDGTVASGGYDGRLILWSGGGDPLQRYQAHESLVNAVAWSPDGGTAGDSLERLHGPDLHGGRKAPMRTPRTPR